MKNLKKVLPVILLILTINVFGQMSNIVTDDELYLASYYEQTLNDSTYKGTIEDGYTANYEYNFFVNRDRLNVEDNGSVLIINHEANSFVVPYPEVKKEILIEKADGGSYIEDITAYTSSDYSVSKVLMVKTYWLDDETGVDEAGKETTYTVIMANNTVYTFLK